MLHVSRIVPSIEPPGCGPGPGAGVVSRRGDLWRPRACPPRPSSGAAWCWRRPGRRRTRRSRSRSSSWWRSSCWSCAPATLQWRTLELVTSLAPGGRCSRWRGRARGSRCAGPGRGAGRGRCWRTCTQLLHPGHTPALVTGHLPGREWIPRSAYEPKGTYSEESRAGGSGGRP